MKPLFILGNKRSGSTPLTDPNEKYAAFSLPESPRAARILEIHGYD